MTLEDEIIIIKQTIATLISKADALYVENYDIRDEFQIKSVLKLKNKLQIARLECNNVLLCKSNSNF